MIAATPKFKTQEWKDVLGLLKEVFDAHSLGIVLLDALERKSAEQIFSKLRMPGGARVANVPKPQLVGRITAGFFAVDEIAFQVVKELDRSAEKERHIVASIPEEQAGERIGSYRAIALKRERAKLVWALARDERETVRKLANRIIKEFFEEVADVESARAFVEAEAGETPKTSADVDFARRVTDQAERLADAAEEVKTLKARVNRFEEERAKLMATIGAKELALQHEAELRQEMERELDALRETLAGTTADREQLQLAQQKEAEARAQVEELSQKVRRLSKLAGASESLNEVESDRSRALQKIDELERERQRVEALWTDDREASAKELARQRLELEATREELHRARQQLARRDSPPSARADGDLGVAIFLDQANIAASAQHGYGRKVDYSRLLVELVEGRRLIRAVAFVVDSGSSGFDAFADILRRSGWELRVKRAKVFGDGQVKADWDVGLALEAVDMTGDIETVVLVSGDGDFAPLVRHLKKAGRRVEVAAYGSTLSSDLALEANRVRKLDERSLE